VHSQGGPDALAHLVALAAIGGGARDALPALVGSAIGIVVRMARAGDGRPRVESVGEVRVSESGATLVELFGSNFAATGQSAGF
jgi:Flp pilus assembly CpaF family ATPase